MFCSKLQPSEKLRVGRKASGPEMSGLVQNVGKSSKFGVDFETPIADE